MTPNSEGAPLVGIVPRARVAYMLGLISKDSLKTVQCCARVRNIAAHRLGTGEDLDPFKEPDSLKWIKKLPLAALVDIAPDRLFIGSVFCVGSEIEVTIEKCQHMEPLRHIDFARFAETLTGVEVKHPDERE